MPESPQATILFVDDDAGNRQTMGYLMREVGYRVLEAGTGGMRSVSLGKSPTW